MQGQISVDETILYDDSPYINWVKELPIPKNEKPKQGIFQSIGKFFFGKTPIVITKPISIIALNPDTLWFLDQGTGNVVQVIDDIITAPSFITKAKYNFSSLLGFSFTSGNEFLFTDSRLNQIFQINMKEERLNGGHLGFFSFPQQCSRFYAH